MPHAANPLVDLTTLADVKEFLGIPTGNTTNDDLLQMLLTAESDYIQNWCNRRFVSQSFNEPRDGTGSDSMMFREYPVSAVATVTVYDFSIPYVPNFSSNSSAVGPGFWGVGSYPTGYYYTSRRLLARNGVWSKGAANVKIAYTAGYNVNNQAPSAPTLPPALAQAALELTAFRYKQKDKLVTGGGQSIDGQSVQFGGTGRTGTGGSTMGDMPDYVRTLINNFRRVTQIVGEGL